ncbi:MAG TPA: NAD(P)-binding protein [Streptosporangiaceae bacterium]
MAGLGARDDSAGPVAREVPEAGRAAGPRADPLPGHVRVAIIGAGFGGLGAGIRLRNAGLTDFVILERAASVGGTWRDNTYPGCTCDVPSHLYSYMRALRGTTIAGFPNLCLVIGPNTGLGHNSMIHIIESQLDYILDYVTTLDRLGAAALDARPDAQERWSTGIERRMASTVWATGGCVSWYLNAAGRNPTLWPGSTLRFRRATRRIDLTEYTVVPRPDRHKGAEFA